MLTQHSWDLVPHTAAKLEILGAYLRAWFPILSASGKFSRIIYVDGFAGPGRYKQGEDGSPIVALKAALGIVPSSNRTPIEFHFVERKRRMSDALEANVEDLKAHRAVPPHIQIHIHKRKTFEDAYEQHIRARLEANAHAPAFALVDPFGWTGFPMRIIADLMKRPSTEVLVNFMFEEINRFMDHPQQEKHFDALFACEDWRRSWGLQGMPRKRFLHDLYRDQLQRAAGARFVRSFEMRNSRNATDYFLYFASNNHLGLRRMKEAMWKVDPGGGFSFSDATNPDQPVLFQPEPDWHQLRQLIASRFAIGRATVDQVERFVVEETPFNHNHYKKVLAAMEKDGAITPVDPPPERKRSTFPDKRLVLAFT